MACRFSQLQTRNERLRLVIHSWKDVLRGRMHDGFFQISTYICHPISLHRRNALRLKQGIKNKHRDNLWKGIMLLQDNTRPHEARKTCLPTGNALMEGPSTLPWYFSMRLPYLQLRKKKITEWSTVHMWKENAAHHGKIDLSATREFLHWSHPSLPYMPGSVHQCQLNLCAVVILHIDSI